MSEIVAAKLSEDNCVVELIVASAEWASNRLGGTWIEFERESIGDNYPNTGDTWDSENQTFIKKPFIFPEA
jgi:hypothetical protein